MDESGGLFGTERQSLGKYVKTQTKYGTTTNVHSKSASYLKHKVCSQDTLTALSLRYGVSVEVIKRENKLWSNDCLFLKDFVLIPVTNENSEDLPKDSIITGTEADMLRNRSNSDDRLNTNSNEEDSDIQKTSGSEMAKDFLSKYDSSFAKIKSDVKKFEQTSGKSHARPNCGIHSLQSNPYDLNLKSEKETDC